MTFWFRFVYGRTARYEVYGADAYTSSSNRNSPSSSAGRSNNWPASRPARLWRPVPVRQGAEQLRNATTCNCFPSRTWLPRYRSERTSVISRRSRAMTWQLKPRLFEFVEKRWPVGVFFLQEADELREPLVGNEEIIIHHR